MRLVKIAKRLTTDQPGLAGALHLVRLSCMWTSVTLWTLGDTPKLYRRPVNT